MALLSTGVVVDDAARVTIASSQVLNLLALLVQKCKY
jgi:hypothetical protein